MLNGMVAPGIALAIAAAATWGIGDLAGGLATRRQGGLAVAGGAQLVGFLLLLGAVAVLRPTAPSFGTVMLGAVGGIFGGVALAALYRGLAAGAMGLVSAVSGVGGVLLPLAVGALLWQQAVGPWQLVGVACALLAVAAASGATTSGADREGLLLAMAAALGFGLWFIFLSRAAEGGQLWALVSARGAATLVVGGAALARRRAVPLPPATVGLTGLVALAGAMDVAANGLVVAAFASIGVGIAAALSGMYPLSTMLLARFLLGERLPRLGAVAVGFALAGIVLISLGA